MSKTYNEILASLKSNMGKIRSDVETTEGTILSDEFEVIADEIEDVYVDIEHIGILGSFLNWDKMSIEELDDLAYNYGVVRKAAIKASGTVYFRTATSPTADIYIPENLIVTTEPDEKLQTINFITTADATLDHTQASSYYNATSGYYEIGVPVEAIVEGTTGNVGVGTIKLIQGSVVGVQNIYNYASFTNGADQESNEDLSDRCLLAIQGASTGTEAGYIAKVMENIYVYDALVVGPGDPLMKRDNGLGGKIDIYIKVDENSTGVYTETEEVKVYGGEAEYTPANQPIRNIVSIVGSISGTLVPNVNYQFTKDTGEYKGSIDGLDKIDFLILPVVGETLTYTYNYFSICQTLTDAVETVRPITADVLIKMATQISVDVSVSVVPDETITDDTEFANDVKTEIETYLTYKDLNGKVEQADLVNLIYNVSGVDNVVIPFTKLAKSGGSGTADISFGKNEYCYFGTITVVVV